MFLEDCYILFMENQWLFIENMYSKFVQTKLTLVGQIATEFGQKMDNG